jgi:nicotinamide mononucleotide (NMN) deamidase PncC
MSYKMGEDGETKTYESGSVHFGLLERGMANRQQRSTSTRLPKQQKERTSWFEFI